MIISCGGNNFDIFGKDGSYPIKAGKGGMNYDFDIFGATGPTTYGTASSPAFKKRTKIPVNYDVFMPTPLKNVKLPNLDDPDLELEQSPSKMSLLDKYQKVREKNPELTLSEFIHELNKPKENQDVLEEDAFNISVSNNTHDDESILELDKTRVELPDFLRPKKKEENYCKLATLQQLI